MRVRLALTVVMAWMTVCSSTVFAEPLIEAFLKEGKLAAATDALNKAAKDKPDDQELRFQLGTVQFLESVETLTQSLWKHGFLSTPDFEMLVQLPIPTNPSPRVATYEEVRKIIRAWVDGLTRAEATLAGVDSKEVRMPLHFGLIRLDLNGDGKAEDAETLWKLFDPTGGDPAMADAAREFIIKFDLGDALWLRGYCHLLMGLAEFALGHDFHDLFDVTGHLFFAKTNSPHTFANYRGPRQMGSTFLDFEQIFDIAAFIHLINLPVIEPDRIKESLRHFEQVIALSGKTWDAIEAETDNDHEWLPNPGQVSVITGARVTKEMIAAWRDFLREAEAILAGKKLLPFWRTGDDRGLNLRRVFTEPRQFDLVLWVQGSAATPYLEKGELTNPRVWDGLMNIFEGRLMEYAIWFN